MTKIALNIDNTYFTELFKDSEEPLLIIDQNKNIVYSNTKAVLLLENQVSITKIQHLFTFDVCILDNKNLLEYNPLLEAVLIKEKMKAEILFQTGENDYKKFLLRSFKNIDNTVIILSDIYIQAEITQNKILINKYTDKIAELETANNDYLMLKERAQNLAIRTGLINRISNALRDSLELDKIIEIALTEISKTLGLDKSYFASYDEDKALFFIKNDWNLNKKKPEKTEINQDSAIKQVLINHKTFASVIMTDETTNHLQLRLVTPVLYHDKLLGILVFYHINNNRTWHEEEISLIEGLTSQLASAVNQARLFETIFEQKNELEKAILRLKETQAQLIQSEKMASLGQLVAGVAHEINTPLGSVNSNNNIVQKCLEKIKEDIKNPDIVEILEEALKTNSEAIKRINNLVKSLKNFARLDEAEYQEVDIHEGLKSTLMLINHEIKNRIEIITEFAELPKIKCYPNQLNQVFMNILVNAYQSIEGAGEIKIKTQKQDNKVVITISDTGKGISKEHLSRIFDPGFTTKGVGVGTGLGLSICYQIIEKHNGKIFVESEEGKGTTFRIEFAY
ncbi:MAG TPA: ATP-binding protein [Candidatus Gastranaerophilales bacterium]|nr:ATP-binding protein [Candidatus Gastranaerophilales bacterium]